MPGSGARRVAEKELRGSDAMRSRQVNALIAAAMLSALALSASEAWGDAVIGVWPGFQRDWTPIVTYGEPDGGSSGIRGSRQILVFALDRWLFSTRGPGPHRARVSEPLN